MTITSFLLPFTHPILKYIDILWQWHTSEAKHFCVTEAWQADAEQRYGEAIYEPKSQRAERLRLAHLPGALLVEMPNNWTLCSSTQDCGRIEFLAKEVEAGSKKKPDTMIMARASDALETGRFLVDDAPAARYNIHQRTRYPMISLQDSQQSSKLLLFTCNFCVKTAGYQWWSSVQHSTTMLSRYICYHLLVVVVFYPHPRWQW